MKKNLIVFGTRPEAIKMIPIIKAFSREKDFITKVCVTGQHREMLDQVLSFFNVIPEYDLNLMKTNQSLNDLTADILRNIKNVFDEYKPDYVYVHGDTTTTMAISLAAFYSQTQICHIEAGLRTYNLQSPFPEEMNRRVTGLVTDFHFAPTQQAAKNLLEEKIKDENVLVTGNTVIDALLMGVEKLNSYENEEIEKLKKVINQDKRMILVTGHRRENHGQGFINICQALKKIAITHKDIQILYPVHLNPNVQKPVYDLLKEEKNIILTAPLSYPSFLWAMKKSFFIITDSGGVQEEAPSLGKPVLVMRENTERPESIAQNSAILVGTDKNKIVEVSERLLKETSFYKSMSNNKNPYGDGKAAERVVKFIKEKNER